MVLPVVLRAALPSIPGVNQLPGVRKNGGDLTAVRELRTATVDADHVRAYARVCGFPVKDAAPLTFPHVLAFPLHLALLASPEFPYPAVGMVHLANSITQRRAVEVGETLQIEVRAGALQAHSRGTAVDFRATATAGGEAVWESTSTYLRRGRSAGAGEATAAPEADAWETVPGRVTWRLGGDVGRRYAGVSGDRNPIHLHPLTARVFGYPRPIAHGMWSLARCVAALENRLPDAVTVEAVFKRPILLPGSVAFGQEASAEGISFALTSAKDGSPHLLGRTRAPAS